MAEETPSTRDIAIPAEFAAQVVPKGARRLGLVVGIDSYADSRIPNLKAAVADARAMHALMVDPACGLFDLANTRFLLDAEATERTLRRELERLAREAGTDDEVWIYFAGHGVVQNGEHRLVPYDGEREYLGSSSVKFAEYAARIRCRRKIVFLDCCHSGATEGSTRYLHSVEDVLKNYDAKGTITFCSSEGDQKSVELPEYGRGAFSYWLERGLRGEADSDGNGVVTSDELWEFVRQRVEREAMRTTGMRQAPRVKLDASGRFALSVHPKAIERHTREREGVERHLRILRGLLGEDAETHLSTDELKQARTLLESPGAAAKKLASLVRKAAEDFERDGNAEAAVMIVRAALQRQIPGGVKVGKAGLPIWVTTLAEQFSKWLKLIARVTAVAPSDSRNPGSHRASALPLRVLLAAGCGLLAIFPCMALLEYVLSGGSLAVAVQLLFTAIGYASFAWTRLIGRVKPHPATAETAAPRTDLRQLVRGIAAWFAALPLGALATLLTLLGTQLLARGAVDDLYQQLIPILLSAFVGHWVSRTVHRRVLASTTNTQ